MWTLLLIGAVIALWLSYRKKCFSVLQQQGIPGPKPNLLFGNVLELAMRTPIKCHEEWFKKYGKIVGYYFGLQPMVLVYDVDLLKKIQVSDFHSFRNRPQRRSFFGGSSEKKSGSGKDIEGFSRSLIALKDKKWKDTRSLITPSFTAAKMKQMIPIINGAIDSLLINVEKKSVSGESFNIHSMFQGLTLDVIGRSAFGVHTDAQNDPNDILLLSCRRLFSGLNSTNAIKILEICFGSLHIIWKYLGKLLFKFKEHGSHPMRELINSVKMVIEARRRDKTNRRPDILQLMIDAETDDSNDTSEDLMTNNNADKSSKQSTGSLSPGKLLRRMTDADILDNSILFFLAGYETTSTALAFTAHFLVHYPEVQEKIREEVKQILNSEETIDYNYISKLQYLDQVLQETMRLYPPVYLFVSRECSEDVSIGNVNLKKGTAIQVPAYTIQRDPDLWGEDADEFNPERFSPENKSKIHPMAFQSFGQGPRNCLGMRFACMVAKLALARLLSKYRLQACHETEKENISLKITYSALTPKRGVWLTVTPVDSETF